jgi:hypothetical protein
VSLRDLGITETQELIYLALLANPAIDLATLARQNSLGEEEMLNALQELSDAGVVELDSSGPTVLDPALGIGRLIERIEDDLLSKYRLVSGTRSEVAALQASLARPAAGRDEPSIERVEGLEAVRERIAELSFFARAYVYAIQPGGPQSAASLEASRPLDMRSARRNLEMRLIHETSVLGDELNRSYLRELVLLGVGVRVTDRSVGRMLILDGQVAVVPMEPGNSRRGALIVRQSGLVAGLLDLFHQTWDAAAELPAWTEISQSAAAGAEIADQDRRLLAMLASGCTDETAARELGVSVRHLRRRISRLMLVLGARSRFEAGVEAARRGWL